MSIWGASNPSNLPDDPFKIEPNWYPLRVVECFAKELDKAEGKWNLAFKFKINQPGSRFDGLPINDKNNQFYVLPDDEMTGEQVQRNAFLTMKLRNGFDFSPEQIEAFEPKMVLGKDVMGKITNNPDKTNPDIIYNNVAQLLSDRLFKERFAETEEAAMAEGGGTLLDEI